MLCQGPAQMLVFQMWYPLHSCCSLVILHTVNIEEQAFVHLVDVSVAIQMYTHTIYTLIIIIKIVLTYSELPKAPS